MKHLKLFESFNLFNNLNKCNIYKLPTFLNKSDFKFVIFIGYEDFQLKSSDIKALFKYVSEYGEILTDKKFDVAIKKSEFNEYDLEQYSTFDCEISD